MAVGKGHAEAGGGGKRAFEGVGEGILRRQPAAGPRFHRRP